MMEPREFIQLREYGLRQHIGWKQRSRVSDLIVQGKWETAWPDLTLDERDPLVENIYNEALHDKAATAGSISPFVEVAPTRGTREDRAERDAQQRRRAFISFMRDSDLMDKQVGWAFDWLQHGAMYGMPWAEWRTGNKHPFVVRFDPRTAYPFAHDSQDNLRGIFFLRYRNLVDLEHDYGINHESLRNLRAWSNSHGLDTPREVEEIWYADEDKWGLAVVATQKQTPPNFRYVNPLQQTSGNEVYQDWLIEPHKHMLEGCPVVEKQRRTPDGEYRGALDDMIPNLKVAHNLMARMLEDVEMQIAAPIGIEGVENLEDWGPKAVMIGDGTGNMKFDSARQPSNFEGIQHAATQLNAARNVGAFPQQRSGEFGASIASAKATVEVMGSYNIQLAWNQRDIATFYRRLLTRTADFDQKWMGGVKKDINGWDEGEMFTDKYDPATFWKDDFRVEVGFTRVGLDESNHLTRLAMARNMGGLAKRSFMRKSGLVDNPLAEEREMALEQTADAFMAFAFAQADQGNLDPIVKFVTKIDGDDTTTRAAILDTIKEMFAKPADGSAPGGGGGDPNAGSAITQERSLEQGGIPGNAEGQPPSIGGSVAGLLPSGVGTAAASLAPGG
jgi:hypothetical protein